MRSTTAIVANTPETPMSINWSWETVNIPDEPEDDQVLVEMLATGICHTDLTLSAVPPGVLGIQYPKIVGHEGSGYVRAIGKNVTKVEVGDPVLLSFDCCRACSQCSSGHPAYCYDFQIKNYAGREGPAITKEEQKVWGSFFGQSSFAQISVVSEASVFNAKGLFKDEEELKLFAPFGCGFMTGAGAVLNVAATTEQDSVMVIGAGAVGFAAIMAAKMKGCQTIVAVDRVAARLELAKELGATHTINTAEIDLSTAIENDPSIRPSVAIDATGVPALIEAAYNLLDRRGKLVFVGIPPFDFTLNIRAALHMNVGKVVLGCLMGDCQPDKFLPEMIQWYHDGKFPVDRLVEYFQASEYEQAVGKLHSGTVVKPILLWK